MPLAHGQRSVYRSTFNLVRAQSPPACAAELCYARCKACLQRIPGLPSVQQHGAQAQAHGRKLALRLHVAHSILDRHRCPQLLLCTVTA